MLTAVVMGFYVEAIPNNVKEDAPERQRKPRAVSRIYTSRAAAETFRDLYVKSSRYPHSVRIREEYGFDGIGV